MIRINRLIKKSSIYKILDLPNVSKIEIIRRKANQKNSNIIRVHIYFSQPNERINFFRFISHMLNIYKNDNNICSMLSNTKIDGFIKESTYNKFGLKNDFYELICKKYNQEFFYSL